MIFEEQMQYVLICVYEWCYANDVSYGIIVLLF